jgi:hypothetical protein
MGLKDEANGSTGEPAASSRGFQTVSLTCSVETKIVGKSMSAAIR